MAKAPTFRFSGAGSAGSIGRLVGLLLGGLLLLAASAPAFAGVAIAIDLSSQRMQVRIDGRPAYSWPVSTARPGYRTPTGRFHPIRLERVWYSSIYDSAPMPHSIFFHGGYAIHGTYQVRSLGRPVSHGCVRLSPGNAGTLYHLVQSYGRGATSITITR